MPPALSTSTVGALLVSAGMFGCGGEEPATASGAASSTSASATASSSAGTGGGGSGAGGGAIDDMQDLLARLRADRDATLLEESNDGGWPVRVTEGRVVVSTDPALQRVAGDFDDWAGTELTADEGFSWGVIPDTAGARYKLSDGTIFVADPWSRAHAYDDLGEMSILAGDDAHLERFFEVKTDALAARTVRVWLPAVAATSVIYAHDGQNLFDPGAPWGGWHLADDAPAGMMIVGIDNTAARMDEYTHVPDEIGGAPTGGQGDAYADLLQTVVRPLVAAHYGEPDKRGLLGSSLGGLVSLHVAQRHPGEFRFAASMSGTLGWGSIGAGVHNETMIDRYAAAAPAGTAIYLDSGGNGSSCADSDGDGVDDDDPSAADNYCETVQMRDLLQGLGYQFDVDLFHWHEPGAEHDEAAWAARVFRPLSIFDTL